MLDALWQKPDELTADLVRRELDSPHVLVRRQAAFGIGQAGNQDADVGRRFSFCVHWSAEDTDIFERRCSW